MNVGQTLTIGGRTAEVIKVRKTAPVAVVRFGDGSTDLHWYEDEPSAPAEPGPVRGSKVKTGGFADAWLETHILGPINRGPSAEQLAELWGTPMESSRNSDSVPVLAIPEHSPSPASHGHETPRQARRWMQVKGWYDRAELCPRCSSQGAYGHQLGFSNVKAPCNRCAVIVAEFPVPAVNGWHRLHRATAPQYALTASA